MKANKGLIVGIIVVLVAALAGGGYFAIQKFKGPPKPQYLTAEAKIGDVEDAVLATGSLQPSEVINVGAETGGRVIAVKVKLGDLVQQGDLIANLDPTNLQNQVRQQETQIQQAQGQLNNQRAQLELTKANVSRAETLLSKGAGTQVQLDQAKANLASQMANIASNEGNVRNQEINLENARNNLEKANIKAPMTGIIAEVVSRQGQTINNNQQVPVIVRLAKMDVMTVRTQVSEADIVKVHPGQKVYFTILGEPGKRYYATLRARELTPAGGVLDPSGGGLQKGAIYYNVLFEVDNKDSVLFPSMTAEVHVVLAEAHNVLTIPSVALGPKGADGRNTVQVAQADGSLAERKVLVGVNNNFVAEIKDGLKVGDKVVIGEAGAPTASEPAKPLFNAPVVSQP